MSETNGAMTKRQARAALAKRYNIHDIALFSRSHDEYWIGVFKKRLFGGVNVRIIGSGESWAEAVEEALS